MHKTKTNPKIDFKKLHDYDLKTKPSSE